MSEQGIKVHVMGDNFKPGRRGRKPMVDITNLVRAVDAAQGSWVKFEVISSPEANSILRQFSRHPGIETASTAREEGGKDIYARYVPGK